VSGEENKTGDLDRGTLSFRGPGEIKAYLELTCSEMGYLLFGQGGRKSGDLEGAAWMTMLRWGSRASGDNTHSDQGKKAAYIAIEVGEGKKRGYCPVY